MADLRIGVAGPYLEDQTEAGNMTDIPPISGTQLVCIVEEACQESPGHRIESVAATV